MAINVYLTSQRCDFVSRVELLDWLNNLLESNYRKIEELCTGSAFCQLMYSLYPESINLKKVKFDARWEYEYLMNFQHLQNAFKYMKVTREIPAHKLIKGRFQDNFELLQWFKRFYNANYGRQFLPKISSLPTRKPIKPSEIDLNLQSKPHSSDKSLNIVDQAIAAPESNPQITEVTRKESEEKIGRLQVEDYEQQIEDLEHEKEFYYQKLVRIEKLCLTASEEAFVRIKELYNILYEVEEGFVVPGTVEKQEEEEEPVASSPSMFFC